MSFVEDISIPNIATEFLLARNTKHSVYLGTRKTTGDKVVIKVAEADRNNNVVKLKFERELQHTKIFENSLIGSSQEIVTLTNERSRC